MINEKHVGSSLDDFLEEQGDLAGCSAVAAKRVMAWQIEEAMKQKSISKTDLAKRMGRSRACIDRLLDPSNPSISLMTMEKAAIALGKKLEIQFS